MTTSCKYTKCQPGKKNGRGWGVIVFICDILGYTRHKLGYGALLVPPACVYTFLFLCRDFFALDVTLVFIRVSGETFFFIWRDFFSFGATFFHSARLFFTRRDFFYFARLFLIRRDFFYLARLFFIRRNFFLFGATFFIWRDFFYSARLFFQATESNRVPSSP